VQDFRQWVFSFLVLFLVLSFPFAFAQIPYPVVETIGKPTILRTGPSDDYDRIVELPPGIRLSLISTHGTWSQVRLSSILSAWVESSSLKVLPLGLKVLPSAPIIQGINIKREASDVRMEILESEPGVVVSEEWLQPKILWLFFQNAKSAIYHIQYDPYDPLIEDVSVWQNASDVVSVKIDLKHFDGLSFIQKDPTHFLVKFKLPPKHPPKKLALLGWRICLDPGHGGADTGAIGPTGLMEKNVTLSIAKMLAEMLRKHGASVVLTRTSDTQVLTPQASAEHELEARVDMGEKYHANLFVSIHCNSRPTLTEARKARGCFVYYYQPQSLSLAWDIARNLEAQIHEPKFGVIFRSFHVVRETTFPAVLVETVFISNPITEAQLKNIRYRKKIAYGIFRGILAYIRMHYAF
jgi:N-acetylmuramoyl-L-alanine amidase